MNTKTKIAVVGTGRMGSAIIACAPNHQNIEVVGQVNRGYKILEIIGQTDVVVDFSHHEATGELLKICSERNKAMVIGTTGHSGQELNKIIKYSHSVPIVMASNFSTGMNTLFWLTGKAAEILGPDYDLEVVEMHHRLKKDAPSGTAKTLAEILQQVRKCQCVVIPGFKYGREGNVRARTLSEIGIHSIRGGDVVGDHTVIFAGNGERLELTHKASSRDTFANGALRAAVWISKQAPGLCTIEHVLGLR